MFTIFNMFFNKKSPKIAAMAAPVYALTKEINLIKQRNKWIEDLYNSL